MILYMLNEGLPDEVATFLNDCATEKGMVYWLNFTIPPVEN